MAKRRSGVNLTIWNFDSRPLKVKNHPDFLMCRWHAIYCWKALNKGYNFALDFILIRGLHAKLWAPKVIKVLVVRILGLPFGSIKTKWHLGASPMAKHKVYYKGEGGGFSQIWAVVSLMSPSLTVACPSNKSVPAMH